MNLIWFSPFEQTTEEGRTTTGYITIVETAGEYQASWQMEGETAQHSAAEPGEVWYTGRSREAMIEELRGHLAAKQLEGFRCPFAVLTGGGDLERKKLTGEKIACYAEKHMDQSLYDALRMWRKSIASHEAKAPFLIASNRLLQTVSAFVPKTIEELLQLPGVGERKAALYGPDLLKLTAESKQTHRGFPLDWVDEEIDDAELAQWRQESDERRQAKDNGWKLGLAEAAAAGSGLDQLALRFAVSRRQLLDRLEQMDKEGADVGPLIDSELSAIAPELVDQAWAAFGDKGDRYLRPVLQTLYDESALDEAGLSRAYEWLRLLRIRFRQAAQQIG